MRKTGNYVFWSISFFHSFQFAISNRKYFLRWRRTICVLSKLQPLNSVKGVRTYKSQNQTMCGRMLPCHVVPGALGCPTFLQHPSFSTASTRSWSACTRTCDTVGSLLTTNTPPRAFLDVILCEDTYKIIRKYKLRCSKKTKCCRQWIHHYTLARTKTNTVRIPRNKQNKTNKHLTNKCPLRLQTIRLPQQNVDIRVCYYIECCYNENALYLCSFPKCFL